jgi:ADP-ribose pyrophosphatase YjhB (NUDIX family)
MGQEEYLKGYSIGVGGIVVYRNKVLLVRRAIGRHLGDWAIPGGFVERGETVDVAVQREVFEEAGVKADFEGVIGIRHRVSEHENSVYIMSLLHTTDDQTHPDGVEVDDARFFALSEVEVLSGLQALSRLVVTKVLQGKANVLTFHSHPRYSPEEYMIYV